MADQRNHELTFEIPFEREIVGLHEEDIRFTRARLLTRARLPQLLGQRRKRTGKQQASPGVAAEPICGKVLAPDHSLRPLEERVGRRYQFNRRILQAYELETRRRRLDTGARSGL